MQKNQKSILLNEFPSLGGAGICEASILLLEEAYKRHKYDYYHLMTGTDLLVKPFEQFDSFFELNVYNNESEGEYKTNYISYGTPNKKMMSRVAYYNFLFLSGEILINILENLQQ